MSSLVVHLTWALGQNFPFDFDCCFPKSGRETEERRAFFFPNRNLANEVEVFPRRHSVKILVDVLAFSERRFDGGNQNK